MILREKVQNEKCDDLDDKSETIYRRRWCNFEMHKSKTHKVPSLDTLP